MKISIITLIIAIGITSSAIAGGWMWFHGDIGTASPFVASSSAKNNVTTRVGSSKKVVTKRNASPASHPSVAGSKLKADRRVTERWHS